MGLSNTKIICSTNKAQMEIPLLDTTVLQVVSISCVSLSPLLPDVHHLHHDPLVSCIRSGHLEWSPSFFCQQGFGNLLCDSVSELGSFSQNGETDEFTLLFYAKKSLSIVFLKSIGSQPCSIARHQLKKV